jgi:hypothetical protein
MRAIGAHAPTSTAAKRTAGSVEREIVVAQEGEGMEREGREREGREREGQERDSDPNE